MQEIDLRLGLAIWGYRGWVGNLFPAGSRMRDLLPLYAERFNCVEGNTTFYATPDQRTIQRWSDQMPPNFRFCPKLPKAVTHSGALWPQLPLALQFCERMQDLGDRLGPLLLQLPPRYGPRQFDDLNQFLQAWTSALPAIALAVEVRHPDWFQPEVALRLNAVLEDLGLGRGLLDSRPIYEGMTSPLLQQLPPAQREKKPCVPLQPVVTHDFAFVRYISHPEADRNQSYLAQWVDWVTHWGQQGKTIYFFVHCPVEVYSPSNAQMFQALLESRHIPVRPLPWNQRVLQAQQAIPDNQQLSLF